VPGLQKVSKIDLNWFNFVQTGSNRKSLVTVGRSLISQHQRRALKSARIASQSKCASQLRYIPKNITSAITCPEPAEGLRYFPDKDLNNTVTVPQRHCGNKSKEKAKKKQDAITKSPSDYESIISLEDTLKMQKYPKRLPDFPGAFVFHFDTTTKYFLNSTDI